MDKATGSILRDMQMTQDPSIPKVWSVSGRMTLSVLCRPKDPTQGGPT